MSIFADPAVTRTHIVDMNLWVLEFRLRDTSGEVSTLSMIMEITLDGDTLWMTPHLVLSVSPRVKDEVWKPLTEKMLQYGVEKQSSGHRTMKIHVSDDPRSHRHEKIPYSASSEAGVFQWYALDFRALDWVIPDTVYWIIHNTLDMMVSKSRMFVKVSTPLMMLARTSHGRPACDLQPASPLPNLLWDICCTSGWSKVDVLYLVAARAHDPDQYEVLLTALAEVKHVRCSWELVP